MASPSFQDELLGTHRANALARERAEGEAGYQRMLDYRQGVAAADDIAGRVAMFGRDAATSAETLRQAAIHQPDMLAGRVAAGGLSERAGDYARQANLNSERDRLEENARQRRVAATEAHLARATMADRDWYRERER